MQTWLMILRDRGLIDGFGSQAHYFNVDQMAANPTTLKQRLDLMASGGVPVYITELDLKGSAQNETSQESAYKSVFPVFYPTCVYLDAVEMRDGRVTSDKVTVVDDEGFSVWPNPFNEGFQVVLTRQESALLQLFNLQGQLVLETLVEGSYNAENIALPAGVYLLKINQNNQVYTRKLVRY